MDFREYSLDDWSNIVLPMDLEDKFDDLENFKKSKKAQYNIDQVRLKTTKIFEIFSVEIEKITTGTMVAE